MRSSIDLLGNILYSALLSTPWAIAKYLRSRRSSCPSRLRCCGLSLCCCEVGVLAAVAAFVLFSVTFAFFVALAAGSDEICVLYRHQYNHHGSIYPQTSCPLELKIWHVLQPSRFL